MRDNVKDRQDCSECFAHELGFCPGGKEQVPEEVLEFLEEFKNAEIVVKFPKTRQGHSIKIESKFYITKTTENERVRYCWEGFPKIADLIEALKWGNDGRERA